MRSTRRELRRIGIGLLFASPWLAGFLGLTLYPTLASFYYSFNSFNTLQPPTWVGLDNFRTLFTNDPLFWTTVGNTLYLTVIGVPLGILLALALALLLDQPRRGVGVYRSIIYVPVVVPPVVSALIWVWILNPENGLLNQVLGALHLPQPGWFTDPTWSKPALIILGSWGVGGTMVILLAGLQNVPGHLYEAAMIDGANKLRRFWHVTLPMLSPVIFYNVVVGVIFSLQYFTSAFVVVGAGCYGGSENCLGAPLNSLLFYGIYLYQNAFQYFKMGYASAMAWLLFALTVVATLILFRFSRRLVYYEGTGR
jgi:multiple sugar transport system permease protein